MVAGQIVRWIGSKIRQCRQVDGTRNVNLQESVHKSIVYFDYSQKLTNQNDQNSHVQYVIKNDRKMSNDKLLSKDKLSLMTI